MECSLCLDQLLPGGRVPGRAVHRMCWNRYMRDWRADHPLTPEQREAAAERTRASRARLAVAREVNIRLVAVMEAEYQVRLERSLLEAPQQDFEIEPFEESA